MTKLITLYKMKNINKIILSIIFTLVLTDCSTKKVPIIYVDNPDLINQINRSVDKNYPENFKTMHHTILELNGKNYVLNGYIKINRTLNQFSIIAQNDLGGTIFKINSGKDRKPEITIAVNAFKESWLKNSVIKDIDFLYLNRPFDSPKLIAPGNDIFKLIQKNKDGIDEARVFKKSAKENGYLLKSYIRSKSKKIIYRIDFKYNNSTIKNLADTIFITNKKMYYKLKINALYFVDKSTSKGKQ